MRCESGAFLSILPQTSSHPGSALTSLDTHAELRAAIGTGAIVPHYQPQVDAETGALTGVEALARWKHPQRGLLDPAQFLPETTGAEDIVCLLGEHMLRAACRDAADWAGVSVGVNVSPVQFRDPAMAARILDIAREEGLPPTRLELEILESAYLDDPTHMRASLNTLRDAGVRIALDDFGTGYSSLSALMDMPLDKLKIDASFVRQSHRARSAAIIHAIVELARAIGLKVTAEGVETREQREFLRAAGCQFLQGYLISKAVPAKDIAAMIATPGA